MYPEDAERVKLGEVLYGLLDEPYAVLAIRRGPLPRKVPGPRCGADELRFYVRPDRGAEGWMHSRVLRREGGGFGYAPKDPEKAAEAERNMRRLFEATKRFAPGREAS